MNVPTEMDVPTTSTAAPTVDEIVGGLKDHVWTLLKAQRVDAAMVLLASALEDYMAAVAAEEAGEELPAVSPEEEEAVIAKAVTDALEGLVVGPPLSTGRELVRTASRPLVLAPRKSSDRVNKVGGRVNRVESP